MENELDDHLSDPSGLTLTVKGKQDFKTIANWSIFFCVLGLFFSVAMLILAFSMAMMSGQFSELGEMGTYLGLLYVVLGLLYLPPIYYMFKFATKMKGAISRNNTTDFNDAINKLKTHFVIMGVMTVGSIVLYFVFIAAMVGGIANEWAL